MKILIFGATGPTGRALVAQALAQGHKVTAFVRSPAKLDLKHAGLTVAQGDVTDIVAVARALTGQEAVLSALGAVPPLKRNPKLVEGVGNIVHAMERGGPRRLIYLSALGVGDSRGQHSAFVRHFVAPIFLRNPFADHDAKEDIIRKSGLDWTIVRPPRLTNGPHTGAYRHGGDIKVASMAPGISRADVAHFMLRQLDDHAYLRKAPAVMP